MIVLSTERLSVKCQVAARRAECSFDRLSIIVEGEPNEVCVRDCMACQKNSGSAYGGSTELPKSAVVQTLGASGESRLFRWISDAGRTIDSDFCPICGDTVFWFVEFDEDAVEIPFGVF